MLTLLFDLFSEEEKKKVPAYLLPLLNEKVPKHYERLRRALGDKTVERDFVSVLRELTNAWIESGVQGQVDDPFERAVPTQVGKFAAKYRPVIRLVDGRVRYSTCSPEPSGAKDPESAARDYATYWFIHLLDSPMRERLSRCEDCGLYFLRERMPKRGYPIKRGMFCKKHRDRARARSMTSTRIGRTDELVRLAAKFWLEWNSQKGQQTLSKWIAAKMNRQLPAWAGKYFQNRDGTATGRWVTEHCQDIEAEAKRRKHATRKN
jgi:hypothetical protein